MTKKEIISIVAKETKLSNADVSKVFDHIFKLIQEEASVEKEVTIANFGKFVVRKVKGRVARNLQTGEPIQIKESHRITFKPFSKLKQFIKDKYK